MTTLARLLGGPPLLVLAKLLFVSLLVGAVLAGLGLTPREVLGWAVASLRDLFGVGFDAVRNAGGYVLTGAVIVVPLWLIGRLLAGRR